MVKTRVLLGKAQKFVRKNWFLFFAAAIYLFFSAYYMGDGFLKCNEAIYGFGDSTAGPIWRNSLKPEQPLFGGQTNETNYPKGENLYSPVNYASSVQTVAMTLGTKLVGPVCSYNLYNIGGYVLTAMAMFAFILYLTKNRWVALLSGYAVSFTPYVQGKIGAHPNYGYGVLLILILWLFLHAITRRKRWAAIVLGVVLAVSCYTDPYFVLLAATTTGAAGLAWGIYLLAEKYVYKRVVVSKQQLLLATIKQLLLGVGVFLLLIMPLLLVRILDSAQIDKTVSSARGSEFAAAMMCSNKPLDYLLPDPMNIYLAQLIPNYTSQNIAARHWCGPAESRVSISLTLLLVMVVTLGVMLWRKLKKRQVQKGIKEPYTVRLVVITVGVLLLFGLMFSLPPKVHGMLMPSGFILKLTTMWRIFAREYLVVNVAVVMSAALCLVYLIRSKIFQRHTYLTAGLLLLVGVGVFCEYQINQPFHPRVFNYQTDVPSVYKDIQTNPAIKVIAEYPIDKTGQEYDSIVYYLTMQAVHGKDLFNSVVIPDPNEGIHTGLKNLGAPQTLPALRYLGIRYLVIHGQTVADIQASLGTGVTILKDDNSANYYDLRLLRPDKRGDIVLAHINDGPVISNILTIKKGYVPNLSLIQSPLAVTNEVSPGTELQVLPLGTDTVHSLPVCFDVKMMNSNSGTLHVYKDGQILASAALGADPTPIRVEADSNAVLKLVSTSAGDMQLSAFNAGCLDNGGR